MKLYSKIFQKNILKSNTNSEFILSLNGLEVTILSTRVRFFNQKEQLVFSSELDFIEEDDFTKTYVGKFADGSKFRFIQPQELSMSNLRQEFDCEGAFSIASIDPQGFAIHFLLVKSPTVTLEVEGKDKKDQIYKLVDASVMAFNTGLYAQSIEFIKRIVELDPNWKISATHPKAKNISDIIDFFQKK